MITLERFTVLFSEFCADYKETPSKFRIAGYYEGLKHYSETELFRLFATTVREYKGYGLPKLSDILEASKPSKQELIAQAWEQLIQVSCQLNAYRYDAYKLRDKKRELIGRLSPFVQEYVSQPNFPITNLSNLSAYEQKEAFKLFKSVAKEQDSNLLGLHNNTKQIGSANSSLSVSKL